MTVKQLFVALAAAVAVVAASDRASAQAVIAPKFNGGGPTTYRGNFPGLNRGPVATATNINPSTPPTVIYGVASQNGIVNPASYLGANLGQTLNTTYNAIVSSNAILTLSSNNGQQGNFGNLGAQGAQGGQVGQVGQAGAVGAIGGAGGAGGKGGAGGAVGAVGALGSRNYGGI